MEIMFPLLFMLLLLTMNWIVVLICCEGGDSGYSSAVGDPGMRRDGLRVGLEAWNFCNEVGEEATGMGSPRAADCFDISGKISFFFLFLLIKAELNGVDGFGQIFMNSV